MDKKTHEEQLSQPLQANNKQFKIAITYLTGYTGIFKVAILNNKFHFKKSFDDGDYIQITMSPGAYEIESLGSEIKSIVIDKRYYSESNYPFKVKPNFSTLSSSIEKNQTGPIFSFVMENSIRNLLGFEETILYNEYNLSPNLVDILSFDNIFRETDIAHGMVYRGKRSRVIHIWTMTVDPGYKYEERFAGGVTYYMLETKDFISIISFKLKNEIGNLVSFNGQSISFRLSIKEV